MLSPNQRTGLHAEIWTAAALTALGYDVSMPSDFKARCCDLIINGSLCVEVKLAMPTTRRRLNKSGVKYYERWQWKVRAVDDKDRVLVLIAQDHDGVRHPFVMPGSIMANRPHFQITSHPKKYSGMLAPFLGYWDVVDLLLDQNYKQAENLEPWRMSHEK